MDILFFLGLYFLIGYALDRWQRHRCDQGKHNWKTSRGTLEGKRVWLCRRLSCQGEKFVPVNDPHPAAPPWYGDN